MIEKGRGMGSDTPVRPPGAGKRGPLRQHPPRRPTGFRVDDDTRLQLEVAAALYSNSSLQGVIKNAVDAYLEERIKDEDFMRAVRAARRRRQG